MKKYFVAIVFPVFSATHSFCQTTDTLIHQEMIEDIAPPVEVVEEPSDEVFMFVEQMPEFPGGQEAMYKFLSDNILYPESARKANIQGKVFAQFVVKPTGEITDIKILRGVSADIDAEAIRVLKLMPKWKPGKQNGKDVAVQFTLPINFVLK